MSIGMMNTRIEIQRKIFGADQEGFRTTLYIKLASVHAYREGRHGSERWANRASFTDATDLFRFRVIPGITIETEMVIICGDEKFEITSVENVKGRGMYLEVLARKVAPSA